MKTYTLLVLIGSVLILLEVDMVNGFTVVDYAGVIALVFKYYHSKCIIILHLPANLYAGT
jgi:glutathione peroxidase-family protein